jgi:endonuclease-3
MQISFDLGASDDLRQVRNLLDRAFGPLPVPGQRDPLGQLVKSLISTRTLDRLSEAAFDRLRETYPDWPALMEALPEAIEPVIGEVTFPEAKARNLPVVLRQIHSELGSFDLDFLRGWPVEQALAWLERLPGVGLEVASATLNTSTLRLPVFVVDTHVHRVLGRYGLFGLTSSSRAAYRAVSDATPGWTAAELSTFHDLLKRLGQTLCRANEMRCPQCPLRMQCSTGAKLRHRPTRS